jgi:hypothetical protein
MALRIYRSLGIAIILILLLGALTGMALAQGSQEALKLSISKVFGYSSGFGSGNIRMQGVMALSATGPDNLNKVTFYLDQATLGEDNQAPFKMQFTTDSYSMGDHILSATGATSDGQELKSNQLNVVFVTSQQGWQETMRFLVPLLSLVFAVVVVVIIGQFVLLRRSGDPLPLGTQQNYGVSGGTICPKCNRPFPLHFFSPHLLTQKLERCPHCGRFGLVRPVPLETLRAAEEAELKAAQPEGQVVGISEEEKLRKELDDSRFGKL